jgi:hypothetical protein
MAATRAQLLVDHRQQAIETTAIAVLGHEQDLGDLG